MINICLSPSRSARRHRRRTYVCETRRHWTQQHKLRARATAAKPTPAFQDEESATGWRAWNRNDTGGEEEKVRGKPVWAEGTGRRVGLLDGWMDEGLETGATELASVINKGADRQACRLAGWPAGFKHAGGGAASSTQERARASRPNPNKQSRQGSKQENPSKQPCADLPSSTWRTVAKRHAGGARSACHGPSVRLESQETQAYFVHTCIRGRPQMAFTADARMHALTQTERQPGLRATAATSSVGTASVPSAWIGHGTQVTTERRA
ncbi:hypothetical protein PCL_03971 [Purpureocillium lilacinum]|uniref:Uncharacterized protein n=1 Tax=Purpureocillium lilacinum TaxID=33203 RepID=A0A2U3EQJ2_PURLI|nr:hypothetical protein PCL_03971 [Purpureocillium lilacinum]